MTHQLEHSAPDATHQRKWRTPATLLLCLCVPLVPYLIAGELPGDQWLVAKGTSAVLFALSSIAVLAADVLLPIPSSLVGTLTAARLGFGVGAACIFLGLMLGHGAAFAFVRWIRKERCDVPSTVSLWMLFLSRPVPLLAEGLVLVAGASRLRAHDALLACAAGNACYALALAWVGTALGGG